MQTNSKQTVQTNQEILQSRAYMIKHNSAAFLLDNDEQQWW